ncbi:MAG TPA: response regulator [Pseudonocardiaceae bacterium]|nr:response regulator [Pseudonocardiaceae bacterium]
MPMRCLLVDDNAGFLESARVLLVQQGLDVSVASTGAEAELRVSEWRPDVVLLDIDLRGESGFDVARRLAGSPVAGLGIILVSTHAERDYAELIDASPALGFLPKVSVSAGAIRALLGRRAG